MNEKKFDELLHRVESGKATPEEKAWFEKWLAKRSAEDPFSKLDDPDRIGDVIFDKIASRIEKPAKERKLWWNPYRAAAAVLLLAAAGYIVWQYTPGNVPLHEATSNGDTRKLIMADGSIVWLKGNSKLIYPSAFTETERRVSLTGEALFEVAKDSLHPFVISTGELTARVLGTSFNIKTTGSNIEVLVLTGKVALSSEGTPQKIIVLPNEKALFNTALGHLSKTRMLEEEPQQAVAKTEYSMNFKSTRMGDVVVSIERKFDVHIVVRGEKINNCPITADLTDQSLDRTLNMISMALGFTYEINENAVTITGGGCE